MPANPFDTAMMAEGYARWRPPVHPHVIERLRKALQTSRPLPCALDVGCGAGLSTAALAPLASLRVGLEPSVNMLLAARNVDPSAHFVAGSAEALPLRSNWANLITAAGSLNWADLSLFFPEARRVLKPGGTLAIYDFGQGRDTLDSSALADWDDEFKRRYPYPPCQPIDPLRLDLAPYGLHLDAHEPFEVSLPVEPRFYLEYSMTETNVADAVERGEPEPGIRAWCARTLADVFQGKPLDVLFRGYVALIRT